MSYDMLYMITSLKQGVVKSASFILQWGESSMAIINEINVEWKKQ